MKLYTITHETWNDYEWEWQNTELLGIVDSKEKVKSVCERFGWVRDEDHYGMSYHGIDSDTGEIIDAISIDEIILNEIMTDVQ